MPSEPSTVAHQCDSCHAWVNIGEAHFCSHIAPDLSPEPHPWYGPCDGFGPESACSECGKARFSNETDWLRWLRSEDASPVFVPEERQLLRTLDDVRAELNEDGWTWAVAILDKHLSALDALAVAWNGCKKLHWGVVMGDGYDYVRCVKGNLCRDCKAARNAAIDSLLDGRTTT